MSKIIIVTLLLLKCVLNAKPDKPSLPLYAHDLTDDSISEYQRKILLNKVIYLEQLKLVSPIKIKLGDLKIMLDKKAKMIFYHKVLGANFANRPTQFGKNVKHSWNVNCKDSNKVVNITILFKSKGDEKSSEFKLSGYIIRTK